jgi:uncharacterized protein
MVSVHVAQLLKSQVGATRTFESVEPAGPLGSELTLAGPLHAWGRLLRSARGILATCDYETRITVECSRCLSEVETEARGHVEEEFVPSTNIQTGEWIPETYDDQGFRIDDKHVLDLDELIRQDILVNVPLRPLCDAACRGLCVRCGQNRNTGACACEAGQDDDAMGDEQLGRLGEALKRELQRKAKGD